MSMKIKLGVIALLSVLFFTQCETTKVDKSSITINDTEFPLKHGFIQDNGTGIISGSVAYRNYSIKFTDLNTNKPKTEFWFTIKSNSTTRLEEGIYQYEYSSTKGEFSDPHVSFNMVYDAGGTITSGTSFSDITATVTSGTVTISKDSDSGNYVFDIELVAELDQVTYNLSAHTNLTLTEY